jgi:hypothetical protein
MNPFATQTGGKAQHVLIGIASAIGIAAHDDGVVYMPGFLSRRR